MINNVLRSNKITALRLLFFLALLLLYLALFVARQGLSSPPLWDEAQFWAVSRSFSQQLIPTWEQLRTYDSPMTPLPFLIFGYLEYFFHGGIFVGRLLTLVLSFVMVFLIGLPKYKGDIGSSLAAVGLLLFPYYLFLSTLIFTDITATFFVFLGFWFYSRERHLLSSISLVLAIASRQYMLAFPLAIVAYELVEQLRVQKSLRWEARWLYPAIAAATILGWIAFFGGLTPQTVPLNQFPEQTTEASLPISWLFPEQGLYFLACLGLYFVIPEWLLFRRWRHLQKENTWRKYGIAFGLSVAFSLFSPVKSRGVLTDIISIFPEIAILHLSLLYLLSLLACLRFCRLNLAFWVVAMNVAILMRGFAWDKYMLPIIVILWYLKSVQQLDQHREQTMAVPREQKANITSV